MDIQLKEFQEATLNKLREYLGEVRLTNDPEQAFLKFAPAQVGPRPRYNAVPGFESVPYVCLRLPTGGGKTIVGAYAIKVAADSYIEKDHPVVLWLVPSNTIRVQTADALKATSHSYRIALDKAFGGQVRVFDITEIENIRPADIAQKVCVVVATIQTLRVEKTQGRDVYAHKEALEDHFTHLSLRAPGLETIAEGPYAGQVKYSFANLMRIHRPMVIVDEAHNARTGLTFDTLKRIAPSCIIELTATPDTSPGTGSNVLYRVSAAELKAEAMIKLPIVLTVHDTGWPQSIADALRTRKRLAEMAMGEADYIRPILLIQAENKDKPANVQAVKQHLLDTEHVDPNSIAVVTGDQRELDKIDLFSESCPIEVVLTVQALKEGWDCSFAYVFCSTANISSSKDVEQLLGRVLRMPYARRRKAPELNKAYAHVSSPHFGEAAKQLQDSLIDMGFEAAEIPQLIEPSRAESSLFATRFLVERSPDLSGLSWEEKRSITVVPISSLETAIEIVGERVSEAVELRLLAVTAPEARVEVQRKIAVHNARNRREPSPAESGARFRVPRLVVEQEGFWAVFDKQLVLDATNWSLLDYPAQLSGFHFDDTSKTFEFDVQGTRVVCKQLSEQQLDLHLSSVNWTDVDLVRWLDRHLRQPDVNQGTLAAWLLDAVTRLLKKDRLTLETLVWAKFILVRKLGESIEEARNVAYTSGYQQLLKLAVVDGRDEFVFEYDRYVYPAAWHYAGSYKFARHFYQLPGELESKGQEFECAQALDAQSSVRHWVRNLAKQPNASFWLQTKTDRFYPDFVAELLDGRVLVVEYKGGHIDDASEAEEKRKLGELWEARSNGKALFVMPTKIRTGPTVEEQIRAKIEGRGTERG